LALACVPVQLQVIVVCAITQASSEERT